MQRIPPAVQNQRWGATSKETAITIVLVVIIAGSLIYSVTSLFSSSPKGSDNNELHFHCIHCAKEFVIMGQEFSKMSTDQDVLAKHPDRSVGMPDCPHCNEKHTGLLMTQCPKCSEHFLRSKVNLRTAPDGFVPPPPICPHCKTDIDKYLQEKLNSK